MAQEFSHLLSKGSVNKQLITSLDLSSQIKKKTIFLLCLREGRTLCNSWNLAYRHRQPVWEISMCHSSPEIEQWDTRVTVTLLRYTKNEGQTRYTISGIVIPKNLFYLHPQTWVLEGSISHCMSKPDTSNLSYVHTPDIGIPHTFPTTIPQLLSIFCFQILLSLTTMQ